MRLMGEIDELIPSWPVEWSEGLALANQKYV